ncbi:MAG: bifunctional nuclease family protein, partial [Actinobacteria bacterium]
ATRVTITEMRDSVYFADLEIDAGGREVHISSRPSDAIALAARTGTPVFALEAVMDDAGVEFEDESEEAEVDRFRKMLEEVTVEDFLGED